MELKLDFDKFDELQAIFIQEIIESVKIKLQEAGLEEQPLEDITASIALSIASIIDDTSGIEANGVEVKPYLTFRTSDEELVHCGENSFTYEHVYGVLKKLFKH